MTQTLDPVTQEIIRNALVAAAEEMSVTVWRTSRSSVVREILDYSTCVFDADGESVAQAARMPVHLNSMASCLTDIINDHIPLSDWQPGDIVITNDPYSGGQHLSDVQTFMPVFVDGERIAIAGILVHHLDVGGGAPGSYDPKATEIYQEGFRIPPLHLARGGVRNEEVIKLFLRNSREPDNVGGDFMSQLAALEVGAANLTTVARRYGALTLREATKQIQRQSERDTRQAIARLADGRYTFADFVDDDGIDLTPLEINVALKVDGDQLTVDLSGSSPQARGPVNCTRNMTSSAVVCGVMMAIGADIPANAGVYRPIRIVSKPGTCVDAISPAPVANRMAVGHRVVNATMGAMSQVLPGEVAASYYGVSYAYALALKGSDGRQQVYFDLECGGWGAHPSADGASGFSCGFHNIANSPIEMLESDYPVTFTEYALAADSGGAGRYRGGLGLRRAFRVDAPRGTFTANLDRFTHPPYGLNGGSPGAVGRLSVTRSNGEEEALRSKVTTLAVAAGDVISLTTSGGGGYGDPRTRDLKAIDADIADGYVTVRP